MIGPFPPVGYKNPPVETRFRKGGPQPNKGRKAKAGVDPRKLLSEPMQVADGDGTRKMHPYELALISMANAAIKKGDMAKAARVLREFDKAGLLTSETVESDWPGVLRPPVDMDPDEWDVNLTKFGPPPWPLPHDGICRLEELRDEHQRRRGL